ncbi:signal peptidase I [Arthrobacter crystallopoietes]|uniref:signal peptidase I n=1 Tax=Crystallibacter crystallopoietes TaxID=37928 RepID=UPI0011114900|nr:signal peptidase I [Arthrobacter crystallopoietes]
MSVRTIPVSVPDNKRGRKLRRRAWVLAAASSVLALRIWVLEPVTVQSDSMSPTIASGSIVFLVKPGPWLQEPRHGDVVVFTSTVDGSRVVKRVVAAQNQSVEIQDAVLYIDGIPQDEPYVDLESMDGTYSPLTLVPSGQVFVMGDNRERSIDSRDYGPLPVEDMDGIIIGVQ